MNRTNIRIVEWLVATPSQVDQGIMERRRAEAIQGLSTAFANREELISVVPVSGADWGVVVYTFRGQYADGVPNGTLGGEG
jgi:hypothetical protein